MPSPLNHARGKLQQIGNRLVNSQREQKVKMPGKSNKFDYTNRANSGAKLGEIIGASLQKEAEKVKKDAERHASKARKQSIDSDGTFDTTSTAHIIDLKAPHKDLGDEGVCAMADGMEIALRSGTSLASLALEDLNLSHNSITTVSLARLAPIVKLAKYDLKTINLSDNNIEVKTDEQAQQWETFLISFKQCMKMRRLDFSGNKRLGSRALEILARMHVNEDSITPVPPGGNHSVVSLNSQNGDNTDDDMRMSDAVIAHRDSEDRLRGAVLLQRRCGLRSIPYITLHDVGLDDAGALWLSYTLEDHFYPSQLITELNATNTESIVKAYQQNTHSRGIDWSNNQAMTKEGAQLLERTEMIREHRLRDASADEADQPVDDVDDMEIVDFALAQSSAPERTSIRAKPGKRRATVRSIDTEDGGVHETTELESARKKIMRHVIGHDGATAVDLWRSSIAIFWASRLVLCVLPHVRTHYIGGPLFATKAPVRPTSQSATAISGSSDVPQRTRPSYASKVQTRTDSVSGEPEFVVTEVTNTPNTPLRLQRPTHRKGAFSEGIESVSKKLNALIVRDDSPLRFVEYQQTRLETKITEGGSFRDCRTPSHLPSDVIAHLISFVVDVSNWKVCSPEQRTRAIQRGQDKSTLMTEKEWLKKDESSQVLMLLDSIECLHYGQ